MDHHLSAAVGIQQVQPLTLRNAASLIWARRGMKASKIPHKILYDSLSITLQVLR